MLYQLHSFKVSSAKHTRLPQRKGPFLALLLSFCLIFNNTAFSFADTKPTLTAKRNSSETITINLSFKSRRSMASTYVILARAIGTSKTYKTLSKFRVSRTLHVRIIDSANTKHLTVHYKTRLSGKTRSKWTADAVVLPVPTSDENAPTEKSPASEPTATPTPRPTDGVSSPVAPSGITACSVGASSQVISLVNKARSDNGLPALSGQPNLANSSQNFSFNMAKTNILSHDGWLDNILHYGFSGFTMGQNIGYMSSYSPSGMVDLWLGSEGHRKNILSTSYKYLGVGCAVDSHGLVWWTQDFGG